MTDFIKVELHNNEGEAVLECFNEETHGIAYIYIPSSTNQQLNDQNIMLTIKGRDNSISKPTLTINGNNWIINCNYHRRPFIRSSMRCRWLTNNIEFQYDEDQHYINFLNECYGDVMKPIYNYYDDDVEGDIDYVSRVNCGKNIVNLINYLRMNGSINRMFLHDGNELCRVTYANDVNDENCFIFFNDNIKDLMIEKDIHLRIVGPLPVDKPVLNNAENDFYNLLLELPFREPMLVHHMDEDWFDEHVIINYSEEGYDFIKLMLDEGIVQDYHELL